MPDKIKSVLFISANMSLTELYVTMCCFLHSHKLLMVFFLIYLFFIVAEQREAGFQEAACHRIRKIQQQEQEQMPHETEKCTRT